MESFTFRNMDINWNVCFSNADWCDENLSLLCETLYCFMLYEQFIYLISYNLLYNLMLQAIYGRAYWMM
jgi:hypothetical protein